MNPYDLREAEADGSLKTRQDQETESRAVPSRCANVGSEKSKVKESEEIERGQATEKSKSPGLDG